MFQKVMIIGNLGRDPEMRYTPSGTAVTNFSIATNRRWTNNEGEQVEEVTWFRISAWGKLAEVCNQYLSKGRQVFIDGALRPDENGGPRVWTGKDGQPRASFEVTAHSVKFLGSRGDREAYAPASSDEDPPGMMEAEDIPF